MALAGLLPRRCRPFVAPASHTAHVSTIHQQRRRVPPSPQAVGPTSPQQLASSSAQQGAELFEWVQLNGGFIHPGLSVVDSTPCGSRGVVTTQPIAAGATVFQVGGGGGEGGLCLGINLAR